MSEIMDWEVDGIVDEAELESFLDRINNDAPLDQGDAKLMLAYYRAQLAACAAGEWRYDVENTPKDGSPIWAEFAIGTQVVKMEISWNTKRSFWGNDFFSLTESQLVAFAVPNPPQVTT